MNIQISSNYQGEQIAHNLVNRASRQLLVIDPQVPDYQQLAAGIQPGVELLILDPNRDGIEQITEYLTGERMGSVGSVGSVGSNLPPLPPLPTLPTLPHPPSLHIISHGSPGTIYLGNSTLELSNIEQYRHHLQQWQVNQLLLYGCHVAAGDAGTEFLQKLSQITQTQIYANPHPTGNAALGGTWHLQPQSPPFKGGLGGFRSRPPSPHLPLSPATQQTYQGILSGNLVWAEGLGTTGDDQSRSIAVDSSGNTYITGHFSGNLAVGTDSLVGAGGADIIITKLDPDGNYLWAKSLGTSGSDQGWNIALDSSDNTYITGHFSGTLAAGTDSLVGAGGEDIIITKLDPNGDYLWAKSLGSTGNDRGWGITLDSSDNIYTIGAFNGTVDFDPGAGNAPLTSAGAEDIFITKFDPNGNYIWAQSFGGTAGDYGYKIAPDGSGNIYTTGHFYNTVDFDPGPGTANLTAIGTLNDIFISKLDASGNYVWARSFGDGGYDSSLDITVDSSGNSYTTGYFYATVDFDPGAGVASFTSTGGTWDAFIVKLDPNGNYIWAKSLGSTGDDFGQSIVLDNSGNTYITGSFTGTVDFDPGPGVANLTSAGGDDIFVVKLDANGDYVWAKNLGGGSNESGYGIAADNSSSIYTTGYFSGTGDFDPNTGVTNLTSVGSNDIFIAKLTGSPIVTAITSAQTDGTYGIGTVIPITVTFSEAVNITGTPTLTLNTGANITYASGSGTDTLTFNYTVATGENTADLDYSSITALALSGGTIKNLANTDDAILTLPTPSAINSLGANKNLIIDGIAPTVTIEQAGGQTDPATAAPINYTVTFSETVTGFDASDISFTGSTAGGTLTPTISGSGTTYNVAVSGMTTSGTVVPSVIAGAVTDAAGNDNTASTSTDNSVTYNTIPTVSNISKTGNEDSNITFAAADFTAGFTDADGNSLNKIQITSLPANGTLQLSGGNVTLNQEILLASIPNLTFIPAANFNGSSSFTWNGSDGSNYAPTAATANLTVAAINDAPSFSNSGNQTLTTWTNTAQSVSNWANTFVFGPTNENTQTVADFLVNVTSGNTLFTTLPDIANDGTLTYTPNGTPGTATVSVQLRDNGGTANGGVDTSAPISFNIVIPPPTVNLSVNTTTGTEAGTTAITLTATTPGPVFGNQTLNLALTGTASNADFSVTIPAQITIANGSSTGSVTLTVANDLLTEGDETATFTISNPSTGILLGTTTAQTITITDDDTAGITIIPTSGLTTTEAGGTATFTVALNTQPTGDVTINLSSDNVAEGTIDKPSLTFTAANWNTAQTVTVTGVDDLVADGNIAYNIITAPATSTDANYNGINPADVAVTNSDNDTSTDIVNPVTPSLPPSTMLDDTRRIGVVQPVGRLDVMEGGGEDIYKLFLTTPPVANVDIAIITDGQTTANVPNVTFTPDNWNIPQVVRLSAVDDNVAEGLHTSNVRLVTTSLDGDYHNLSINGITVSIADNETVGLVRSLATASGVMGMGADDQIVGSVGDDVINGRGGNNYLDGGDGDDVLSGGAGADYITGGAGLDLLFGGPGEDYVDGGDDDDVIFGGMGSDRLYGGTGNDKLFGEQGNDYLFGGAGADSLTGGPGRDAFAIGNGLGGMTVEMADVMTDFVIGEDVIDLISPLVYDGVAISDGTGLYAGDALVQNALTGEFLARLQGVDALSLSRADFV
ncbi:MAG TPA: DUF4347 domain-containing protein [Oscillatoriaceae cyanobacterium M33_DOE_052]|nr:DUF4347 domain-containing protein [Oscillatoriaceae cyanobacterium M33_DOE_052]